MRRFTIGCACLIWAVGVATGEASFILAPTLSPRDTAMSGNTVAVPTDAGSILYWNPAGIASGGSSREVMLGAMFFRPTARYTNPATGYSGKSAEEPILPVAWAGRFGIAGWSVGAGLYGSVGSAFSFPPDPEAGIPSRFFGELTTLQLGLVAGRTLLPGLDVGIQLAPTYSALRLRSPSPLGAVRLQADGAGVMGSFGLLYRLDDATTLGLGYRSPGIVFLDGDARIGETSDDVDFDLYIPQTVTFGIAREILPGLVLTGQARWADYPQFEKGELEFERNPMIDRKPISDARAVFRYGAAFEYAIKPTVRVRAGVAREPWMMEPETVSPVLVDFTEVIYHAGVGFDVDRWTMDFEIGAGQAEDRVVTPDEQPLFPGRYELKTGVAFGFMITYRFGSPASS